MKTAVKIEKIFESLSSFINLLTLHTFIMFVVVKKTNVAIEFFFFFSCNLRYLYIEIKVNQTDSFEKLQNFCRHSWQNFYSLQQLLHNLAEMEIERVKLDRKFQEMFK